MNVTPIIIISAKHPEHFKHIQKISQKWGKRTKRLPSPWPKEGTFDVDACECMEQEIRDYKPRDKSKKRQKKRELELKLLNLFKSEGLFHRRNLNEGVAELRRQQVEVDKINQHDSAGLQGDFEITDHKTLHEHPEALAASSSRHEHVQWQTLDWVGLGARLPDVHEGASKWIRAFEEETAGKLLALGIVKAVWAQCFGAGTMENILRYSDNGWMLNHQADGLEFNAYRAALWRALRAEYPVRVDPGALKGEPLSETESPTVYIARQLKKWRQETEEEIEKIPVWVTLFRDSIIEALPAPAQRRLEDVVGLKSMSHGQFRDYVVHAVEKYRKDELKLKEQDKNIQRKLVQLQLKELQGKQKVQNGAMTAGATEQPSHTQRSQGQVHYQPCQGFRRGAPGGRKSNGAYWTCGEPGHVADNCLRARGNWNNQHDRGQSLQRGARGPAYPLVSPDSDY